MCDIVYLCVTHFMPHQRYIMLVFSLQILIGVSKPLHKSTPLIFTLWQTSGNTTQQNTSMLTDGSLMEVSLNHGCCDIAVCLDDADTIGFAMP